MGHGEHRGVFFAIFIVIIIMLFVVVAYRQSFRVCKTEVVDHVREKVKERLAQCKADNNMCQLPRILE